MEKSREESRRRFKEAFSRIYFPVIPSPQLSISQGEEKESEEDEEGMPSELGERGIDPLLWESERFVEEDEEEGIPSEMGEKRLTRSQRKRLRKRKLKESAAAGAQSEQRRKIIGPMLPSEHLQAEESASVRTGNLS